MTQVNCIKCGRLLTVPKKKKNYICGACTDTRLFPDDYMETVLLEFKDDRNFSIPRTSITCDRWKATGVKIEAPQHL